MNADAVSPSIGLRNTDRKPGGSFYQLVADLPSRVFRLMAIDGGQGTRLGLWPFPKAYGPGDWVRLELRMVGENITVSADGQKLGSIDDNSRLEAGGVVLFATAHGYFRDIEYIPLDGTAQ